MTLGLDRKILSFSNDRALNLIDTANMRVLVVLKYIPSFKTDRKADAIYSVINAHEAGGTDVTLLTTGRIGDSGRDKVVVEMSPLQEVKRKALRLVSSKWAAKYRNSFLMASVSSYHKFKDIKAILAVCTSDTPALHAAAISAGTGLPFIVYEHRTLNKVVSQDYRHALSKAKRVLAVSPQLASAMNDLNLRSDVQSLPLSIPDKFFEKPFRLNIDQASTKPFLFAAWTRWRPFKRLDILIKAFARVKEGSSNVRLIVAGKIETLKQRRMISRLVAEYQLQGFIQFRGQVGRDEIHKLAHSCNCCVISSDHETFGLPALEAVAAGRPVITTRCGGPESIITSEKLGFVVEKGDADLLASAMSRLMANSFLFNSAEIQRHARENYSEQAVRAQWLKVYQ